MPIAIALLLLNLIPNPGLEETAGLVDGLPAGWHLFGGEEYIALISAEGRASERSLELSGTGGFGGVTCGPLQPRTGRTYIGGGWVKVEGEAVATIKLDYSRDGKYVRSHFLGYVRPGQGWQACRMVEPPGFLPEATEVSLACALEGNGTAWFDDLYLYAVAADETAAGNLLPNPSAESGWAGRPYGFEAASPEATPAVWQWTSAAARTGLRGIRLRSTGDFAVVYTGGLPIDRAKTYRFGGWVRCHHGIARLKVDFQRGDAWIGQQAIEAQAPATGDWVWLESAIDLSRVPDADHLAVVGVVEQPDSEADFDDLLLVAE